MNRRSVCNCNASLDQFLSTRPRRTKLPKGLWRAAVKLAAARRRRIRIGWTTCNLRSASAELCLQPKKAKPEFVELITPHSAPPEECVIEFESTCGGKMRIQWKAPTPPDWASLLRARLEAGDDSDRANQVDSAQHWVPRAPTACYETEIVPEPHHRQM